MHFPKKGGAGVLPDGMGGKIGLTMDNIPPYLPQVRAGKIRALAVSPAKRTPAAPDVPTVAEAGVPGYEVSTFYGVSAPAKTPRPIIDRLHAEIVRALNSPDLKSRLQDLGADPVGNTPEQYTAFMQNEITKWAKVIKAAGIKGD